MVPDLYARTFTFWRFLIHVPLGKDEMVVHYSINNGQQLEFWVPGRDQNMRWAAYSVYQLLIKIKERFQNLSYPSV